MVKTQPKNNQLLIILAVSMVFCSLTSTATPAAANPISVDIVKNYSFIMLNLKNVKLLLSEASTRVKSVQAYMQQQPITAIIQTTRDMVSKMVTEIDSMDEDVKRTIKIIAEGILKNLAPLDNYHSLDQISANQDTDEALVESNDLAMVTLSYAEASLINATKEIQSAHGLIEIINSYLVIKEESLPIKYGSLNDKEKLDSKLQKLSILYFINNFLISLCKDLEKKITEISTLINNMIQAIPTKNISLQETLKQTYLTINPELIFKFFIQGLRSTNPVSDIVLIEDLNNIDIINDLFKRHNVQPQGCLICHKPIASKAISNDVPSTTYVCFTRCCMKFFHLNCIVQLMLLGQEVEADVSNGQEKTRQPGYINNCPNCNQLIFISLEKIQKSSLPV